MTPTIATILHMTYLAVMLGSFFGLLSCGAYSFDGKRPLWKRILAPSALLYVMLLLMGFSGKVSDYLWVFRLSGE